LPDEKKVTAKKKTAPKKKKTIVKSQEPSAMLDPPSRAQAVAKEAETAGLVEDAPSQDTSGIVELPPQILANHIEV